MADIDLQTSYPHVRKHRTPKSKSRVTPYSSNCSQLHRDNTSILIVTRRDGRAPVSTENGDVFVSGVVYSLNKRGRWALEAGDFKEDTSVLTTSRLERYSSYKSKKKCIARGVSNDVVLTPEQADSLVESDLSLKKRKSKSKKNTKQTLKKRSLSKPNTQLHDSYSTDVYEAAAAPIYVEKHIGIKPSTKLYTKYSPVYEPKPTRAQLRKESILSNM